MGQASTPATRDDVILLVGRVAPGAIFVKSGLQKLLALSAFAASLAQRGVPQSSMWAVIGATVEFVSGVLIVAGLRTREASLLMILFVIVATGISHRFWDFAEAARRKASFSKTSRSPAASCCCSRPAAAVSVLTVCSRRKAARTG